MQRLQSLTEDAQAASRKFSKVDYSTDVYESLLELRKISRELLEITEDLDQDARRCIKSMLRVSLTDLISMQETHYENR